MLVDNKRIRQLEKLLREYVTLCGENYSSVMPPEDYLDRVTQALSPKIYKQDELF